MPPTSPNGFRRRLVGLFVNLALLLVSVGVVAGATEVVARLVYSRPWYEHLADTQEQNEHLEYRMNSFGLRGDDFAVPKPPGERRVYMAGDSFTFGMGVADIGQVMPSLVERALNEGDSGPVDVLNAGMLRGSLPRHWLSKWHQVSGAYDPDVLLIVFFLRDGTKTGSIPAFFHVIRDEITTRNQQDFWYRSSYLYRIFRDRLDRRLVAGEYTQDFQKAYFGAPEEQKEWVSAQYNVLELKRLAEERGATVGFVIYPILVDLKAETYPFDEICSLLEDFARRHDLPTLNLLPAFRGLSGPELWVSPLDQHPNAAGHAVAADAVTPFVAELLASR